MSSKFAMQIAKAIAKDDITKGVRIAREIDPNLIKMEDKVVIGCYKKTRLNKPKRGLAEALGVNFYNLGRGR